MLMVILSAFVSKLHWQTFAVINCDIITNTWFYDPLSRFAQLNLMLMSRSNEQPTAGHH